MKTCEKCGKLFPFNIVIDGKLRNLGSRKYCLDCTPFKTHNTKNLIDTSTNIILCKFCGKPVKRKPNIYCSNICQSNYIYKIWIEEWLLGKHDGVVGVAGSTSKYIYRYLRETRGNKCEECGWDKVNIYTGNIPVELEHIDGNYKNNTPSNLKLLCPNCHSLTSTFRALNMGNGREGRRKKIN